MKILLKAGMKKQRYSLIAIALLFFIMTVAATVAISVNDNARQYISSEMDRLGFGEETIWISWDNATINSQELIRELEEECLELDEVKNISTQKLIFAGYSVGEQHSDDEGQMVLYEPDMYPYHFLNDSATSYQQITKIKEGEIYVSPAMASTFHAQIGDTITFRLSRDGISQTFLIAGYFEDPFMGSSMIDRKSFLIGKMDYTKVVESLSQIDSFTSLGRSGAMLHIFQDKESELSPSELGGVIQSQTEVGTYTEFTYSKGTMLGFMIILQNIMAGFLLAFAGITGFICALILGHSISNSIEQEYRDMAILKTMGATSLFLRTIQALQYIMGILSGIFLGFMVSLFLTGRLEEQMVFSTGLLIQGNIVMGKAFFMFLIVILVFLLFIVIKTRKVLAISPITAIQGQGEQKIGRKVHAKMNSNGFLISYAIRQVVSQKKRYVGIMFISFLLVTLAFIVGKMNKWLGPNGEGLMNSFSVAEHDIGIQPNHEMDMGTVEQTIKKYVSIQDTYELAMQSGMVNGIDYTINVLDEPEWFHVIEGRTCSSNEEVLVSEYVASDLGVSIGNQVSVSAGAEEQTYTIVGIYACANEMGANVGMIKEGYARIGDVNGAIWCKHYVLSDSSYNETIMQELQKRYPMDMDVHTNSWSGLDSIVRTMKLLTAVMYGIVLVVVLAVVMLTSSKMIQMEQQDLAILKSLGASDVALRVLFMLRFGIACLIGGVCGTIFSIIFVNRIVGRLLGTFGISDFIALFSWSDNLGVLSVILLLFLASAYLYAGKMKRIDIMELIQERY